MKRIYLILVCSAAVIITAGAVVLNKVKISVDKNENGTSISIIGGADGPTSVFLAGKSRSADSNDYKSITMNEAKSLFAERGNYRILDVRRAEEFAEGHIPGAINIANESIGSEKPEELPDLNEVIYVYCRSGRRSKEAAEKLAAAGYTGIVDCGGILDWTGDIEK